MKPDSQKTTRSPLNIILRECTKITENRKSESKYIEWLILRLEARGVKQTSINTLRKTFRMFLSHAGIKAEYVADDVRSFLAHKTRSGCKPTTVHNYYRYLKTCFKTLEWEWTLKPRDAPKKNTPQQPYYNLDEQRMLEEAAGRAVKVKGRYGELLKLRNRAMIRLSQVTMLRMGEMRMLDVEDYRRPIVRIRSPMKNSEYTERILDPETCDLLDEYLEKRKRTSHSAMFITGTGKRSKRISLGGLSNILKRIRKEARIDKDRGGWHAFRRGGITIAHREGMSAKAISKYTGITEDIVNRYIQLDREEAKEMFVDSHPFFKREELSEADEVNT
jgi:integrase